MEKRTIVQAILAKMETQYGVDPILGAADAMLVKGLELEAMAGSTVSRDLVRPFMGQDGKIPVGTHVKAKFDVEATGAGIAGNAPAFAPLLRASGLAEVFVTGLATIAASSVAVGAVTGGFTYTKNAAYTGTLGRLVTLVCTTPGGTGVAEFTVTAPPVGNQVAYNQMGQIMTNGSNFPLGGGAVIVPTITSDFVIGDKFTIALRPVRMEYLPVSQGFESAAFYVNRDGTKHALLGARGTVALAISALQIPYFKFEFTGLWSEPIAQAVPQTDTSAFQMPIVASSIKTPIAELYGVSTPTESATFDLANSIEYRELIGGGAAQSVRIINRQPKASIKFEDPGVDPVNLFNLAKQGKVGPFRVVHGTEPGEMVEVFAPYAQLGNLSYEDSQGVQMLSTELALNRSTVGDDELGFAFQ